jgi:glycosyltransferase involved in cell wall biosynthesis
LISVVLTTRDRPQFLRVALECYRRQTYARRELIVVDDGQVSPVDETTVREVGGTLLRLDTVTPLGAKLNMGLGAGRGRLCAKMDDDDWYAPTYLEKMVDGLAKRSTRVCRPTIAFVNEFLFFDLHTWTLRHPPAGTVPGATLVFAREDWQARPFRQTIHHEDMWYLQDQLAMGVSPLPVIAPDVFIAVRHRGAKSERGHSWTQQWQGTDLDALLRGSDPHRSPEEVLPAWAIDAYRTMQSDLVPPTP